MSLTAAATAVLIGLTLSGFAARWWWRFEQACHFRVQYLCLLLVAAIVLSLAKRRALAATAGTAAIMNAIAVLPVYWPPPANPAAGPEIKLVAFNVLSRNDRKREVLDFLRREQADIVLLAEINHAWAESLVKLDDLYPHRKVVARTDNFGIALLSRHPWRELEIVELGAAGVPTIVAEFGTVALPGLDAQPWLLVGTHPLPPGSRLAAEARNEQLREIASLVKGKRLPTVVAGDLNITEYSPFFGDLLRDAELRDSRQGFGIHPSWGPTLPMEIAIDHCLVSPPIAVRHRAVGPHLGSDHRPVTVRIQLPGPRPLPVGNALRNAPPL